MDKPILGWRFLEAEAAWPQSRPAPLLLADVFNPALSSSDKDVAYPCYRTIYVACREARGPFLVGLFARPKPASLTEDFFILEHGKVFLLVDAINFFEVYLNRLLEECLTRLPAVPERLEPLWQVARERLTGQHRRPADFRLCSLALNCITSWNWERAEDEHAARCVYYCLDTGPAWVNLRRALHGLERNWPHLAAAMAAECPRLVKQSLLPL
jgi:hypothetical protein